VKRLVVLAAIAAASALGAFAWYWRKPISLDGQWTGGWL
jgi:hypothetical protein